MPLLETSKRQERDETRVRQDRNQREMELWLMAFVATAEGLTQTNKISNKPKMAYSRDAFIRDQQETRLE